MPTYQYRCTECGRDLEVVQKFSDASLTECPTCSGALRKVFNAVGVVFKGSGFYRTDSRAAGKDGAESGDKKPAEVSAKGGENGTSSAGEGKSSEAPAKDSTSKPKERGDKPAVAGAGSGAASSTGAAAAG